AVFISSGVGVAIATLRRAAGGFSGTNGCDALFGCSCVGCEGSDCTAAEGGGETPAIDALMSRMPREASEENSANIAMAAAAIAIERSRDEIEYLPVFRRGVMYSLGSGSP